MVATSTRYLHFFVAKGKKTNMHEKVTLKSYQIVKLCEVI